MTTYSSPYRLSNMSALDFKAQFPIDDNVGRVT